MATAMIYDTLKLAERLEREAGFDGARARAMARVLAENAAGNLATREDLLVTKGELQAAIQSARSDLDAKIGRLEGRIGGLESRVGGLEGKIGVMDGKIGVMDGRIGVMDGKIGVLYWMTGTTLAGTAALLGIAITVALHVMHLE